MKNSRRFEHPQALFTRSLLNYCFGRTVLPLITESISVVYSVRGRTLYNNGGYAASIQLIARRSRHGASGHAFYAHTECELPCGHGASSLACGSLSTPSRGEIRTTVRVIYPQLRGSDIEGLLPYS